MPNTVVWLHLLFVAEINVVNNVLSRLCWFQTARNPVLVLRFPFRPPEFKSVLVFASLFAKYMRVSIDSELSVKWWRCICHAGGTPIVKCLQETERWWNFTFEVCSAARIFIKRLIYHRTTKNKTVDVIVFIVKELNRENNTMSCNVVIVDRDVCGRR
jgi:hypothetical protein